MASETSHRFKLTSRDRTRAGIESAKRNFRSLEKVTRLASVALGGVGISALGSIAVLARSVSTLDAYNRKLQQTEALLRVTGNASGQTIKGIAALADEIARGTLVSEGDVLAAANQLLTFKSIASETFEETLRLAQDLAATGFGSIQSATLTLAKALEDPVARLGELSRVGITVSKSQRDLVKDLVETGRKAEAQGIILKALRDQIGGAGAAESQGTLAGAVDNLGQSWREFQRAVADGRVFNSAVGFVTGLERVVSDLNDSLGVTSEGTLRVLDRRIEQLQVLQREGAGNLGVIGFTDSSIAKELLDVENKRRQILLAINRERIIEAQEKAKAAAGSEEAKRLAFEELQLTKQQEEAEKSLKEAAKETLKVEKEKAKIKSDANIAIAGLADAEFDEAQRFLGELKTTGDKIRAEIESIRSNEFLTTDQQDTLVARRIEQQEVLGTKTDEVSQAQAKLNDELEKGREAGEKFGIAIASNVGKAIREFKSLGDVVNSVLEDILSILITQNITAPLSSALGSLFGGGGLQPNQFGGSFLVAGGGGRERPVTVSAQQGEIIDISRPTDRSRSSSNVIVNINNAPSTPAVKQNGNQIDIDFAVSSAIRNGPKTTAALGQRFSLTPALSLR